MSHPAVHAFGHPTGRLIGSREPVAFDVERVAAAAAARGVAMEINASPDRLDLSDVNGRLALEKGCRFVIDTDAHAVGQLDNLQFGVFQARRAGLTQADVWNTRSFSEFDGWRRGRRQHGAGSSEAHVPSAAQPTSRSVKPAAKLATRPAVKPRTKLTKPSRPTARPRKKG